jgi:hypothetical protein
MKRIILLAVVIAVASLPAYAQSKGMDTTDGLVSACRLYSSLQAFGNANSDKYTQAGFCIGYMAGFAHASSLATTPTFCLPPTINLGEVVRAFVKYVDEHPQELNVSAKVSVSHALQSAYPCKENPR